MRQIFTLAILGLLWPAACGTGSTGGGTGGTTGSTSTSGPVGLAAKDYCRQTAAARCQQYQKCEGVAALGYETLDDCLADRQANACKTEAELCYGRQIYQPTKALACIEAWKDFPCSLHTAPAVCMDVCTDPPSSSGTLSGRAMCRQIAAVTCDKAFSCPTDSPMAWYRSTFETRTLCTSERQWACGIEGCSPGLVYRPDNAQRCLDQVNALSCEDDLPFSCSIMCTSYSGGGGAGGTSAGSTGGMGGFGGSGWTQSSSSTVPPEPGPTFRETCEQATAAFCRCPTSFGYTSEADCLSKQTDCASMTERDMCPGGQYHPSKGLECVNAVATMSCGDSHPFTLCDRMALCN